MSTLNPICNLIAPCHVTSSVHRFLDIFVGGNQPIANKSSNLDEMDKLLKLTKDKTQNLKSHITRI